MAAPTELSFEEILKFILSHGGKVTNYELVKHFKVFLTNPETRDDARNTFKKYVNTLATIKNENNEKWLILKRKYCDGVITDSVITDSNKDTQIVVISNKNTEMDCQSPEAPEPPLYRPPPPVLQRQALNENSEIVQQHYLQRKSIDTTPQENIKDILYSPSAEKENALKLYPKLSPEKGVNSANTSIEAVPLSDNMTYYNESLASSNSTNTLSDADQTVSVKERKQMFNKMASDMDVLRPRQFGHRGNFHGIDEEDRASIVSKGDVEPLDERQKEWVICAARGDYHILAKMCNENPKLVKTKVQKEVLLRRFATDVH